MKKGMVVLLCALFAFTAFASNEAGTWATTTPTISSDNPASINGAPAQERFGELDDANVLLIRDAMGWSNANEEILIMLAPNNVTYDIINSSSLPATDLSLYDLVVTEGGQSATFNQNILDIMAQIETFVSNGGWLQFSMATNSHAPRLTLWDGTTYIEGLDQNNYMGPDGAGHPLQDGVAEPYEGNYASHGTFTVYPGGASVIVVDTAGDPTVIEYAYGNGNVIVWTMPLEFSYTNGYSSGPILYNAFVYTTGD
ncbi:MAG TPA: hypothetical protein ENH10_05560, partial [Bacteroidetes bacterium]|nr:hypothetical protein [Bacteroidota bacterium]HEX04611.1 hypothetical protein [Bacteroidota bacterium]